MPVPGDVFYLPAEEEERLDPMKGDRPHVLLSANADQTGFATLAYASTKPTEASWGAAHVRVDPLQEGRLATGLSRPTFVYPSRLVTMDVADLSVRSGRLARPLPLLRRMLVTALGLGTGVTTEPDRRGANRRGRVVKLNEPFAARVGYSAGMVITDPAYSRTSRHQIVVPILSFTEFEPHPLDVIVEHPGWVGPEPDGSTAVLLAVPLVASVYEYESIDGYLDRTVDAVTMRRLEESLRVHFAI